MNVYSIRLKIAKATNDKSKAYANMLKGKERAEKAMEKFRELESTYNFYKLEIEQLKEMLKNEHDRMDEG